MSPIETYVREDCHSVYSTGGHAPSTFHDRNEVVKEAVGFGRYSPPPPPPLIVRVYCGTRSHGPLALASSSLQRWELLGVVFTPNLSVSWSIPVNTSCYVMLDIHRYVLLY